MTFDEMRGDVVDIIVQCGDCHWRGPQKMLRQANGLAYCPECGREFNGTPALPVRRDVRTGD